MTHNNEPLPIGFLSLKLPPPPCAVLAGSLPEGLCKIDQNRLESYILMRWVHQNPRASRTISGRLACRTTFPTQAAGWSSQKPVNQERVEQSSGWWQVSCAICASIAVPTGRNLVEKEFYTRNFIWGVTVLKFIWSIYLLQLIPLSASECQHGEDAVSLILYNPILLCHFMSCSPGNPCLRKDAGSVVEQILWEALAKQYLTVLSGVPLLSDKLRLGFVTFCGKPWIKRARNPGI